jgi:hypothetical protein
MAIEEREIETSRPEKIICPWCAQIQDAKVIYLKGESEPNYYHKCIRCEYIITEEEWDTVDEGNVE